MAKSLDIYIGWDSREPIAYEVAKRTILDNASIPVQVKPIVLSELVEKGAYTREVDPLASTEFTYSRFFTPWLAGCEGWALFCDCDFLFFSDVAELLQYQDPNKAVCCVKHDYTPKEGFKMDGKVQTSYPRKNWSSFMMFNCAHPSTRKLTPELINRESGAYLHRMQWAADDEIGEIPTEWNWLEGWNEKPAAGTPHAVHFTNGGPWFKDWQNVDYGDEWRSQALQIDPEFKPI
ncbi:glycosyltransferase [Phyllobacterium sp. 628]|uniref:glycosyltransferase n=1 Tax=Phyllobacterium sp. 628 TaxID=2718938 RepID=UPI00166278B6|nr:glycosyltransferase [Phyllobacterium sp. 628]QND52949.1 glycosyltransferase [Phyllobacterium sp. 628]